MNAMLKMKKLDIAELEHAYQGAMFPLTFMMRLLHVTYRAATDSLAPTPPTRRCRCRRRR
jgi:hypothetical protein